MKYPTDIDEAAELWGANCGPCALAAILERSLADTRALLDSFEQRQCMNIGDMQRALAAAGRAFTPKRLKAKPSHGLVFVQWGGHESKPTRAQYLFTHWIAVSQNTVFDVNLDHLVDWPTWEVTVPEMMIEDKRGNGTYFIRSVIEVGEQ